MSNHPVSAKDSRERSRRQFIPTFSVVDDRAIESHSRVIVLGTGVPDGRPVARHGRTITWAKPAAMGDRIDDSGGDLYFLCRHVCLTMCRLSQRGSLEHAI